MTARDFASLVHELHDDGQEFTIDGRRPRLRFRDWVISSHGPYVHAVDEHGAQRSIAPRRITRVLPWRVR